MQRRTLTIMATALLLVATLFTTGPASASDEDHVDIVAGEASQTVGQAEEADVKNAAQASGLSTAQIRKSQAATEKLGKLQAKILQAPGLAKVFAGAGISDTGQAVIYLKGRGNQQMTNTLEASELDLEVVKGRKHNIDQQQRRADAVHKRLGELGFNEMATTFDISSGKVEAAVSTRGYNGRRQLPANASDVARTIRGMLGSELQADLDLKATSFSIGDTLAAVGGMTARNDGRFTCTIGWPVRQVESPYWYGITTAGHCNINEAIEPAAGFDLTGLYFQQEHTGRWGDIEWHTADAYVRDDFIADEYNNVRDIASVESIAELVFGERICVYGQSSDQRDCSRKVFRTSLSCTIQGYNFSRLVQMDGRSVATFGDSGGGWSWGNRVYGSVLGGCGFPVWDVMSFADFYDEALGVRVIS